MTSLTNSNREEDYLVKATINVGENEICGIPCKIYLPERIYEKPYVILKPSKQEARRIMVSWKGSLKATIYGFNNEIQTSIETPEIYFSGETTKYWGNDISDTTIPGEPQDLHIIQHLKDHDCKNVTRLVLWISPNKYLTPFMHVEKSYTGDIKCKRVKTLEFTIRPGLQFTFDKHFGYKTHQKKKDLIQWSFLVACTEIDIPATEVETLKTNILSDIDDFLLISSFAAKQHTSCLGWTASDNKSHTTFYRGNYTFPEVVGDDRIDDGNVDVADFQEYIQTCYPVFQRFENRLALRNSLYAAIPAKPRTLESSFLGMFSGLETLILDFKRRMNMEFVLPEGSWNNFRKYLESCIKRSTEPKLEKKQRASIYNKLSELNRIFQDKTIPDSMIKLAIGKKERLDQMAKMKPDKIHLYINTQITQKYDQIKRLFKEMPDVWNGSSIMHAQFNVIYQWSDDKLSNIDKLRDWIAFNSIINDLFDLKLNDFVDKILNQGIVTSEVKNVFYKGFYRHWLDYVYSSDDVLMNFNSSQHEALIERFTNIDSDLMNISKLRLIKKLNSRRPQTHWVDAPSSEQSIVKKEVNKKRKTEKKRWGFPPEACETQRGKRQNP